MIEKKATVIVASLLIVAAWIAIPRLTFAHCDSIDGPVVKSAIRALKEKKVDYVLKWIPADFEHEIKETFKKTLKVRTKGKTARQLADRFFFETLVRLHRQGEGAPYTGLKPAGTDPGPAVTAADHALKKGSANSLVKKINLHAETNLKKLFKRALEKKKHANTNAAAGREYVEAYVAYVHYVENLIKVIHSAQTHHKHGAKQGAKGHAH